MNFKRNITGISVLGIIGALSLTAVPMFSNTENSANTVNATSKYGDINSDGYINAVDASIILSYYAYTSTTKGTPMTLEKFIANGSGTTEPTTSEPSNKNVSLKTGGDTFTIAAWNHDEITSLISNWTGIDAQDVIERMYSGADDPITAPSGAKINFVNLNISGASASEKYDELFNNGEDIDVYLTEPYWALKYMDNDELSAPLSSLGITEKDMSGMYPYTLQLAKNSKGEYKAVPYNVCPGAFIYRSDIAEKYLGVDSPEKMQAAIGDWSLFASSAKTISEKSGGKMALADSLAGMWQAYSCGRFDHVTSDNKLELSSDVKAFADMAKELWECGGVTKNHQWSDEWTQAGQKGQCMGYFVPSWAFFYDDSFVYEAANKQAGKWSICTGPQSYYWGGNDLIVNPSTDNGDDARSFILSSAFNSDNMKKYARSNNMPNNSTVNAQISNDNSYRKTNTSEILNPQNYYMVFDQNARGIDIKKYSPYDATINSDIIELIKNTYIEKNRTWDDTMTELNDKLCEDLPDLKQ